MTAIFLFCILSVLLVTGKFLRIRIPLLQKLYLPSSVIGGLVGLLLVNLFRPWIPEEWITHLKHFPGFLINIIFATLFLGTMMPKAKKVFSIAFPQICLGQLLAWGQYVVGLGVAGFLLVPLFHVPPAFGNLLEIGFEGGHGTVGGMQECFVAFNWEDGIALGYTVATVGMIVGIVLGMMLVNWAHRKGYVKQVRSFEERSLHEQVGIHQKNHRPSAGHQTVCCDSVDSLAWHLAIIGLAVLIGVALLKGLQAGEIACFPNATRRIFKGFPLFPLCMIGGVLLQWGAKKCHLKLLVDHEQMQRISGASLDFLVLSAVTTIQISVVLRNWLPLLILTLAGTLWSIGIILWVAPKIFKEAWFERSIAEFGQASGVTATGLLLLRTVDPENKTIAAASFGYKQLIHEPIMGGGIWTAMALTLVFTCGWFPIWVFCVLMLLLWGGVSFWVICKNRRT